MSGHRIVVVDDKRDLAQGVALVLKKLSDNIAVAYSAEEALELLEQRPVDVILSDIKMPGQDGVSLLDCVRERWPSTRVILFTAYGTIESAVDAIKRGAFDYLTKPFDNAELLVVTQRALKEIQDEEEIARLRAELRKTYGFHGLYSRDRRMLPVLEAIRRVAPTNTTVFLWGESGTGKELVARAIHIESSRSGGPFVAFNAAALPETLVESELFGCKKGAYTGADADRKGLFAEAHGATLLIDEVSSMPLGLQGKLLRALQEREVLPLGSSTPVRVDVRVIAASNVDPRRLVHDGKLRQDLYYRLSVMRIAVPPLRERVEDIPLLANLFLERLAPEGRPPKSLAPRALRLLISHDWPGNVRELQNVIQRALLKLPGARLAAKDLLGLLPTTASSDRGLAVLVDQILDSPPPDCGRHAAAVAAIEAPLIAGAIARTRGNQLRAAELLGMNRNTLRERMRALGMKPK